MKQLDSPVRIYILPMRPLRDEHNGSKACNDADSCAIVRQRVHRIYLAAPLNAQAWAEVQTGLSSGRQSHLVGALHWDAVEVPAHPAGCNSHIDDRLFICVGLKQ